MLPAAFGGAAFLLPRARARVIIYRTSFAKMAPEWSARGARALVFAWPRRYGLRGHIRSAQASCQPCVPLVERSTPLAPHPQVRRLS
eukprot:5775743-Pyramimonas_sp.AAC.1